MTEWISVNDQLPEIGQTVMCFRKWKWFGDKVEKTNDVISLKYTDEIYGKPLFMDSFGYEGYDVQYWMPLPIPPTKVNETHLRERTLETTHEPVADGIDPPQGQIDKPNWIEVNDD